MRDYRITFKLDTIVNFEEPFNIEDLTFFYSEDNLLAQIKLSADNPMDAQRFALDKITSICSAISYLFKYPVNFYIQKVEEMNEDGTVNADMNTVTGSLYVRKKLTKEQIDEIAKINELMLTNQNLYKVMQLINRPDYKTWVTLYKIFEIIDNDSKPQKLGWITEKKKNLFKQTANNPKASGLDARHGFQKTDPPKTPMELGEAIELIDNLINLWINHIYAKTLK